MTTPTLAAQLSATPNGFVRDGKTHLIISGAIHYFRVHPDDWQHRLQMLAAMGCNTVETYVAWNFHAPDPHTVDFTGWRDLGRFLDLAQECGLDAIVRPGPYICAEWEAGGFPHWLLADRSMPLRVRDERYEAAVAHWFAALLPIIVERQADRGGNVIMVQVENEYGSFGDDTAHLEWLRDLMTDAGISELLVTSDGPGFSWLSGGVVSGAVPTVNFGSRTEQVLQMCAQETPDQPLMCMEFWHGWFDHWGEPHHTREPAEVAAELDTMLSNGMSVNFYMAHGGTNFELWNGANFHEVIQPTVTSYDYDAPISEDGRATAKFHAFREVIGRYRELGELRLPPEQPRLAAQPLRWDGVTSLIGSTLWNQAPAATTPQPRSFEESGLHGGWLHLRRTTQLLDGAEDLRFYDLHDRAHIFVDQVYLGTVSSAEQLPRITMPAGRRQAVLDVLIESQGRINFGPRLGEGKGVRGIWYGTRFLTGWEQRLLPLDRLGATLAALVPVTEISEVDQQPAEVKLPLIARATVTLAEPGVGFIDVSQLGQGYCWVNGFLVGRYWSVGPQQTLHVPTGVWRAGANQIVILETEQLHPRIALAAEPRL